MTPEQMEAHTRREDEIREILALESAWDKIDRKIETASARTIHRDDANIKELPIRFTLLELKMLRQFRRKFA